MSKEMEQNQEPNGHMHIHHYQQAPLSPTTTETTFEVFSKDEAFKKSQKSSGISYAEKVQSYLTDQKTTGHPFDGSDQVQNQSVVEEPIIKKHSKQEQSRKPSEQEQNRKTSKTSKVQPLYSPEDEVDYLQRAQEIPDDPRTQTTHHRDHAITQASLLPAHENEKKLEESVTATRRSSLMEAGKNTVTKVSPTVSRNSSVRSNKRPLTPQEFLTKIQDFVKNAEMDAESTHWPATVSSSTPSQPIITEAFRARKNSQNSLSRQQAPDISIEEPPMLKTQSVPVDEAFRKSSVAEQNTLKPVAPVRQRSPKPGYGPKPRDHSPFCVEGPSIFDECLRNPITSPPAADPEGPEEKQSASTRLPQLSSRIAPSAGKSYLDKPSTSPDPFGARVEMDAPPSVNQAVAASSSIMNTLRREADQRKYASEMMDDVITLDLRTNQEKLEYLSVPSDYSHKNSDGKPGAESDVQTYSSLPNRGRSPRKTAREVIPADRHIPQQLQPDP